MQGEIPSAVVSKRSLCVISIGNKEKKAHRPYSLVDKSAKSVSVGLALARLGAACVAPVTFYLFIMPLLQGQRFKLVKNPENVDPSTPAYIIPHTGEVFLNSR